MALLKCKMCGNNLDIPEGSTVCECNFCKTKQTLPRLDNAQTLTMLSRATLFRQRCEFDKAEKIYSQNLDTSSPDPELYWSMALCRYGVEYIDDPISGKKTPICHRAHKQTILEDENYLRALQLADSEQRELYRKEAQYIGGMQKKVLEIAAREEPFDVFICYKELDDEKNRTPDSTLTQEVYDQLTKQGFRVFCIQSTLQGMPSTEYEPYIFSALNTAKVMIVIGTKPEYFNAVWVKNDWNRFLMLMREHPEKRMIPVYRDMDPFAIPDALSIYPALNMSKISFLSDLVQEIQTTLEKAKAKETPVEEVADVEPAVSMPSPDSTNAKERMQYWTSEKERLEAQEDELYAQLRAFRPKVEDHADEIHACEARIAEIEAFAEKRSELRRQVSLLEHQRDALGFFNKEEKRHLQEEIDKLQVDVEETETKFSAFVREREELVHHVASMEELDQQKQQRERRDYENVMVKKLEDVQAQKQEAIQKLFEAAQTAGALQKGDTLTFGSYRGTPIEWLVLDVKGNKMYLITKNNLDVKPYHATRRDVTWENCSLRKWLNREFIRESFTENEREKLIPTMLQNPDNTEYKVRGGEPTEDKIFLLSMNDIDDMTEEQRSINGWWWLRSPGSTQYRAAAVNASGGLDPFGGNVHSGRGVRPVCWIQLN